MTDEATHSATAGGSTTGTAETAGNTAARDVLLQEHAEQRRRRDASPLGSPEYRAAATRIAEIEVEIARLERAAGLG